MKEDGGDTMEKNKSRRCLFLILFIFILSISTGLSEAKSPIKFAYWTQYVPPEAYQPNWDGVTHIGYSAIGIYENGTYFPLSSLYNKSQFYTVRDQTHQHGKKFIISVASSNYNTIDNLIAYHKDEFANNTLALLQQTGADGINLNFEYALTYNSVTGTPNEPYVTAFMKKLNSTLKSANPNYEISFCGSPGADPAYYNSAPYIDYVFIMGYEYAYYNGQKSGPNCPYNDSGRLDVTDSVNRLLPYYNKSQIILGVPFYGKKYKTDSGLPCANITRNYDLIGMKNAIDLSSQYGRLWDANSSTPWTRWQENGTWFQVWYEDNESLKLKYEYVKSDNISGIGWWALAYERGNPSIWDIFIDNKTCNITNINKTYAVKPVTNFSSNITSGKAPLIVGFIDTSKGTPTSWNWSFGDRTYSTIKNPTHSYINEGNYTVSLTVSNEAGNDTLIRTNYVKVTSKSQLPPIVKFWGSRTSGIAPLTVYFTDNSTNSPTSWSWNFGDGTPASTVKNPKHIYSTGGNYTVTLTARNEAGSGTKTRINYIKVIGSNINQFKSQ